MLSTVSDFFHKVNDGVGGYLWAILAAAVILLVVILFLVIAGKNRRIKKLKKELKNTRTELETEKARANEEKASAAQNVEQVEFDDDAEPLAEESAEQPPQNVEYYNRTTEVSQKGGNIKYTVVYDRAKDSWVIKRSGSDRVVRRVDTKEQAMTIARSLCKKHDAALVVHKKDGKFQKH